MNTKYLTLSSLGLSVIFSGCATTSIPISSPNGKLGHAINCSYKSMTECYQKAGGKCGGKGYNILNQKNNSGHFLKDPDKILVVECK